VSAPPDPLQGLPPSDAQKRLVVLFAELEKDQPSLLDQAGKRIIELCTAMLGILFAVMAFGKDFPPAYLGGHPLRKALAVAVLALYLLSLLSAVLTVQPRRYPYNEQNLTILSETWSRLLRYKITWMRIANWSFFAASLALALLIARLVLAS
jgi:O-antigen/teichoic acid export membrane protein